MIVLLLGSSADKEWAEKITSVISEFGIVFRLHVASAHKTPEHALKILAAYESQKAVIYICIAGRSNALGGFVDAQVVHPVINCPPYGEKYAGLDIFSSLRMPSGVAPVTVLEPEQAALAAVKMLALTDFKLKNAIKKYHESAREKIIQSDKLLSNVR